MTALEVLTYSFASLGIGGLFFAVLDKMFFGRLRLVSRAAILAFLGGCCACGYARYIEPNWIDVHTVKIHDRELAQAIGKTRIVQITDIHITAGLGRREKTLIRKINAQDPDVVFFTGDLADHLSQLDSAVDFFKQLKPRLGIFAIAGDTDRIFTTPRAMAHALAPAGINFLVDETRKLRLPNGRDIWIAGLNPSGSQEDRLRNALAGVPADAPIVLLAHSPRVFDAAVLNHIPLVLVGDTHGGQVGIPFLVHLSNYADRGLYMSGLFQRGQTKMYVNRGIGTKGLSIRFFCRPEIAVFRFEE